MSLFKPQRFQPNSIFFNLEMGALRAIFQNPEIPMDFEATLPIGGTGYFEMTLFDQTGKDVEPYFWQNFNDQLGNWPEAIIQWGYLGTAGNASPPFRIQMAGYTVEVLDTGSFSIRFVGSFSMSAISSSNPNGGTLNDIVKKFANDHQMTFDVVPPFDSNHMLEYGKQESDSTEYQEARWHKMTGESDWSFLERVLQSGRDVNGVGNYTACINLDDNGQVHLLISHPTNDQPQWVFRVQDKDSTVISWKPEINFANVSLGGAQITNNNYQRSTGDHQKFTLDPQLTTKYQTTFGYPLFKQYLPTNDPPSSDPPADSLIQAGANNITPDTKGGSLRNRTSGSSSHMAGFNPKLVEYLQQQMGIHKAQLVVAGDPVLSPFFEGRPQNVEVIYDYQLNYKNTTNMQEHHTSGIYRITSVTHSIKGGNYTCVLSLERSGPSRDPAQAGQ